MTKDQIIYIRDTVFKNLLDIDLPTEGKTVKASPRLKLFIDNGLWAIEGATVLKWDDVHQLIYYISPNSGARSEFLKYVVHVNNYEDIQEIEVLLDPHFVREFMKRVGYSEEDMKRSIDLVEGRRGDIDNSFKNFSSNYNNGDS